MNGRIEIDGNLIQGVFLNWLFWSSILNQKFVFYLSWKIFHCYYVRMTFCLRILISLQNFPPWYMNFFSRGLIVDLLTTTKVKGSRWKEIKGLWPKFYLILSFNSDFRFYLLLLNFFFGRNLLVIVGSRFRPEDINHKVLTDSLVDVVTVTPGSRRGISRKDKDQVPTWSRVGALRSRP